MPEDNSGSLRLSAELPYAPEFHVPPPVLLFFGSEVEASIVRKAVPWPGLGHAAAHVTSPGFFKPLPHHMC